MTAGSRRVADTAEHEMEVAREFVRQHPLAAVAGVATLAAALAGLAMSATRR